MLAMRMGITEATFEMAIDRGCGGSCRGMLLGAPQFVTGGTQGFTAVAGDREQGSAMEVPEARGSAGGGAAGETRTEAAGSKRADVPEERAGYGRDWAAS